MVSKKLLLIINLHAGRNRSRGPLFDAVTAFSEAGYLVRIEPTRCRGDATRLALEEAPNYDVVVACGGDGTLSETVAGLLQLEKAPPLGYIPQGSTNDFAASLEIPSDAVGAAEKLLYASGSRLDVGDWNGRSFVYVASFGIFTRSSYAASQAAKNALGHFAYLLEGMTELANIRAYRLRITADGENLDGTYLFGAVCNATSIGGMMKLSRENVTLDDGKFELLLIPAPETPVELQELITALLAQDYAGSGVIFRHIRQLRLETDEDLPWSLDGEYAESAPVVEVTNRRQALRMLL